MRIQAATRIGVIGGGMLGVLLCGTGSAGAVILVNGGFETGDFTDWEAIGNTHVLGSIHPSNPIDPTEGASQAVLLTVPQVVFPVPAAILEAFLELAPGALDSLGNGTTIEGSAIKRTFLANAGDSLSLDWNLVTNEGEFFKAQNDFAFVTVGSLFELVDVESASFSPCGPGLICRATGYQTSTFPISATGSYTLGVGVVDVNFDFGPSELLVDNVRLNEGPPGTSVIPEPSSFLLLGSGLLGLAGWRRKFGLK
jgi:hypothetical protein